MNRKTTRFALNVWIASGLLTAVGAITVSACAQTSQTAALTHDQWRIKKGYQIAPVPLDLRGRNTAMVGLGSYLVNAIGGCNDCHTNPSYVVGGDPFLGQKKKVNAAHYLAGGQQFGPFVSRNLTPERGLPAGRTYPEFLRILRTGIDLDKAHPQYGPLLQVMPWPTFQSMSDYDIRSIYEYLSAIPPALPGK